MDINQIVNDFIRDAQWRIAELTQTILANTKEGYDVSYETDLRDKLIYWVECLYEPDHKIRNGYNHLYDWSAEEIESECEYLRELSVMAIVPSMTFVGYTTTIRAFIVGDQGGGNLPLGNYGDHIVYNISGQPIAEAFPDTVGWTDETIEEYFQ